MIWQPGSTIKLPPEVTDFGKNRTSTLPSKVISEDNYIYNDGRESKSKLESGDDTITRAITGVLMYLIVLRGNHCLRGHAPFNQL